MSKIGPMNIAKQFFVLNTLLLLTLSVIHTNASSNTTQSTDISLGKCGQADATAFRDTRSNNILKTKLTNNTQLTITISGVSLDYNCTNPVAKHTFATSTAVVILPGRTQMPLDLYDRGCTQGTFTATITCK
jgi:hypothetical protein